MPDIKAFQNLQPGLARVHVRANGPDQNTPVIQGQRSWNIFGRAVARLSEWFRSGKEHNRSAGNELVSAVRQEYGDTAANTVQTHLQTRALAGKPLSSRRVDICLRLAQKFAVPDALPGVDPKIVQALRDPGKPHLNAITQRIAKTQASFDRARNSAAMLGQFQQASTTVVGETAKTLSDRCQAFQSIASVPEWQASVLAADTSQPIDEVLSNFLMTHSRAQPPVLSAQQRDSLFAELPDNRAIKPYLNQVLAQEYSPGGSQFADILSEAAAGVFGGGFDASQIPLTKLGETISDAVRAAAGKNAPIKRLSAEEVRGVSLSVVQSRCERLRDVAAELASSGLDDRAAKIAGSIWAADPNRSADDVRTTTRFACFLNDAAISLAAGNFDAAMEQLFQAYSLTDLADGLNQFGLRAAVEQLSPAQRLAALETMRSTDRIGELLAFKGAKFAADGVSDAVDWTLGQLDQLAWEISVLRDELAFRVGIPAELLEAEAGLKPVSYTLSLPTRSLVERFHQARTEFASAKDLPAPPALDLDGVSAIPPPSVDANGGIKRAYAVIATERGIIVPVVHDEALVVQSPNTTASRALIPTAALALSGVKRLEEIQDETREDLKRCLAGQGGALSFEDARADPILHQFMVDNIVNIRTNELYSANGQQLFVGIEPGEARWLKWQSEIRSKFGNEVPTTNALNELPGLITQRIHGDLVTLNANAHGFAPVGMEQDGFRMAIEGVDAQGYLTVKMNYSGKFSHLARGNPSAVHETPGTYEMSATFRYRPNAEGGQAGELFLNRHVCRYELD
jgi:hypothetical protein